MTRENLNITAGPEFSEDPWGKNLIINNSFYGLKTRFSKD
jgi:hypothetical protein